MPVLKAMDRGVAIQVVDLGKKYHIGARRDRTKTFREAVTESALRPLRVARAWTRHDPSPRQTGSIIWALRNVSFDVQRGEVVGVIGRNGAGKSTLLKVLTRITNPDEGFARIRGRVGSLLEVGTGFHGELTGRENIYLNGAILGMRRDEIDRKFDEIVDFSGVERFIDTPVKHFSSGMYLRLAFSVAAHLEPEILLVDEVLAVGDAEFQQKCLGKMSDVAGEGRTVLFVSHNMSAIQHLCSQVLVLDGGQIRYIGDTQEGIVRYLTMSSTAEDGEIDLSLHPSRRKGALPILKKIRLLDKNNVAKSQFMCGEPLKIELTCDPPFALVQPHFGIGVDDWVGARVFSLLTRNTSVLLVPSAASFKVVCQINELPLVPGQYTLSLSAGTTHETLLDALDNAVTFRVEAGDFFGSGKLPAANLGRVLVRSEWSVET
jgi:lipopolysaccharide transport system ATP-binding protein